MRHTSIEDFFEFEKSNSLFDYKDSSGYTVWDILRYHVFIDISSESSVLPKDGNPHCFVVRVWKSLNSLFQWMICYLKSYDYVFYLSSRTKLDFGYVDINASATLANFNSSKVLIIESFQKRQIDTKHKVLKRFPLSVLRIFVNKRFKYDFTHIYNLVKSRYPHLSMTKQSFSYLYLIFHSERILYSMFLRKWQPKLLFLTQNGVLKGLLAAGKETQTSIFEFQHGAVTKSHPLYSYPDKVKSSDIYLPKYYGAYSDFWIEQLNMPGVKAICIGNDYLAGNLTIEPNNNILVISQQGKIAEETLRILVETLNLNKFSDRKIIYKLHPYQSCEEESFYKSQLSMFSNVTVVRDVPIQQLLQTSNIVIAVSSTCIFEALHNGLTICILKVPSYESMSSIFDYQSVRLINDPHELCEVISLSKDVLSHQNQPCFFDKFNSSKLQSVLVDDMKLN